MENAPHINIAGNNVPPELSEKFYKWYEGAYAALWLKIPGLSGLDRYQIVKKNIDYPGNISIYHHKNRNALMEFLNDETRLALVKDQQTTFYRIERVWHDGFALTRSFRNDVSLTETTMVDDASIIYIEGYKLPQTEFEKYDQWFMKWASHVYIPILMKTPGLKGYNCLKWTDAPIRWDDTKYLKTEIPPYISILYFENMAAFQNYSESLEYIAFKRNMELEFPGSLSIIWNVEYQLVKSWRK